VLAHAEVELEHDAVGLLQQGTSLPRQQGAPLVCGLRPMTHVDRVARPLQRGAVELAVEAGRNVQQDLALVPLTHDGTSL
jgi:hypothetical protein